MLENSSLHRRASLLRFRLFCGLRLDYVSLCLSLSLSVSVPERRSLMFIASLLSIREIVVEGNIRRNVNL